MIRILLCDDDEKARATLADLIATTVTAIPYNLIYASSLTELIAICADESPHITFVDVTMGGSTEDDVLAALPKIPPPVIITTNIPADTFREGKSMSFLTECYAAGAKEYLVKGSPRFLNAQQIMLRTLLATYASSQPPTLKP